MHYSSAATTKTLLLFLPAYGKGGQKHREEARCRDRENDDDHANGHNFVCPDRSFARKKQCFDLRATAAMAVFQNGT